MTTTKARPTSTCTRCSATVKQWRAGWFSRNADDMHTRMCADGVHTHSVALDLQHRS